MHHEPTPHSASSSRLPDLGPHGEGWVAIQVGLFGLLAVAGSAGPAWGDPWLAVGRAAGVLFVAAGIGIAVLGLVGLRENLTAVPRPIEGGRLIDTGVYGMVRHPIYSGGLFACLGIALMVSGWLTYLYVAALFVLLDFKSRREERWLVQKFPGYPAYQRRVRKLVPFVY